MFRIKYNDHGVNRVEDNIQDIRTLYDILIGILNDEKKEEFLGQWCSNAHWGDTITLYGVTIDCYRESDTTNSNFDKNTVITKISNTVNLPINFNKMLGHVEVWNIGLGISVITYDNISNNWKLEIRRSNEQLAWPIIAETSANMFMPKAIKALTEIKNKYKFEQHELLQKIANRITEKTGIQNDFIGEDNGSLTWDFGFGTSFMKNCAGNALYFACNDNNGKEIFDIKISGSPYKFVDEVSNKLNKLKGTTTKNKQKSVRNEDILKKIKETQGETHLRIYEDNCWWLDIEKHPYGHIRFWVGFEDKRNGKSRASLVSLSGTAATGLKHCTDGIILKKAVQEKLYSTAKYLISHGIMIIN